MPSVRKEYLKVVYVLKGRGGVESPRFKTPVRIGCGDLVLVPPRVIHAFRDEPDSGAAYVVLCVRKDVFRLCNERVWRAECPVVFHNHALAQEADRLLRKLFFEQYLKRAASAEMTIGLTVQFLAVLARARQAPSEIPVPGPKTAVDARILGYLRNLDEHYQMDEKIDNVATRLGMSRRTFTAAFRRLTGVSWLPYLRALRIRKAKALLLGADQTTLWVALECGFQDLSTFYRAFRASEGLAPAQWKEANQPRRSSPARAVQRAHEKL